MADTAALALVQGSRERDAQSMQKPAYSEQSSTKPMFATLALITGLWLVVGCASQLATVPEALARALCVALTVALVLGGAAAARSTSPSQLRFALIAAAVLGGLALLQRPQLSLLELTFVTASLLSIGGLVGGYVGGLLDQPAMLSVTAYVAALGDVFSFAHPNGITSRVLQSPRALQFLAVSMPSFDERLFVPVIGVGDIVFGSMFMVGTRRVGLSSRKTVLALSIGLVLAGATSELLELSLPAIPAMSIMVVLFHRESWHLPVGQERRVLANLVGITVVLGGLLTLARWNT
jgi:hypothetical protein